MKILNLYAGIGGNRKLWGDEHEITAVELDEKTAEVYKHFFPNDKMIIADAHEYLLHNYKNYDFIWSSPPCPSHSDIRRCVVHRGQNKAIYPDMALYQEIILLKHFANKDTLYCVENVIPYYEPLIKPDTMLGRHYFWNNFKTAIFKTEGVKHQSISGGHTVYGFNIKDTGIQDKRKALRNTVNPELGLHILNCAMGIYTHRDRSNTVNLFDTPPETPESPANNLSVGG